MKYYKCVQLKNGAECVLRNPNADNAQMILQHMIQTSGETENMARYPDEITMTTEQEKEHLSKIESSPDAIMISAVMDGKIVANAGLNPINPHCKSKHRAGIGISIKKDYWGMGIGSAVLSAIIESAVHAGYEQIELDVVASNNRAVELYKKFGFQLYGTLEKAFKCRDGRYEALHLMLLRL